MKGKLGSFYLRGTSCPPGIVGVKIKLSRKKTNCQAFAQATPFNSMNKSLYVLPARRACSRS
jgi:hypothetical protein